jgi:RNA polymerase primary sigma factor
MRQLLISKSITNRESRSFEKYLQDISRIEMISPEEEARLTSLIKCGDVKAMNRLVNANLRFVVSVAKKYQGLGLALCDLVNEGNFGLIEAARRFDETRGFRFISYAVWWIRQSILMAIADQAKIVRLPFNKLALNRQIQKASLVFEQQFEREPTVDELAGLTSLDEDDITRALTSNDHLSLNAALPGDEESCLADLIENPNAEKTEQKVEYTESLKKEMDRSLSVLTAKQKEVICYFFGIGIDYPMSLDHIGQKMDISRERVRQIKEKAIERLRTSDQSQLKSFLG